MGNTNALSHCGVPTMTIALGSFFLMIGRTFAAQLSDEQLATANNRLLGLILNE